MKKLLYSVAAFFTVALCAAQSPITQAEYFWDNDPGQGSGIAVQATDGTFNSAYEQLTKTGITLPAVGLHVFNIRIKDNLGTWGPLFRNVVSVQVILGNDDVELKNLAVFPNPVKNVLNISLDREITSVTVYNFLGQEVMNGVFHENAATIDLSALMAGSYFVKVNSGEFAKVTKIIKE